MHVSEESDDLVGWKLPMNVVQPMDDCQPAAKHFFYAHNRASNRLGGRFHARIQQFIPLVAFICENREMVGVEPDHEGARRAQVNCLARFERGHRHRSYAIEATDRKKRFFSPAPIVTITATTPPLGTLPEGSDNEMLRPYRLLLVVIALNLPKAARSGDLISQLKADGSSIGPALEWKQATPSPFARVESPAAVVKGYFYLFGGFTDDLNASNRVDVYDPATDTWNRKKDMPVGLTHLNAVVDGDHIWFAGGFKGKHPGPVTDEVWKYDIASDSWAPGPPLPEPRAGGGLAVVEHRLYYFGGYLADRETNTGDHWSLAIEGGKDWQREPDLPDPRGHLGVAVLESKIYALGGDHGHDVKQIDVSSCHRFDPTTKKWSAIASLPDGRSHFESSTIIHKGRILIVGGRCNSSQPPRNVVGDILQYDPDTDHWLVVGKMPEKLLAPAAAIISGRLVVTGGGLVNPRPLTAATRIAAFPAGK